MLTDKPRTDAYIHALSRANLEGLSVMDVGAGSGILSLLAVKHGAELVHAVEAAPKMATLLQATVENNNMSGKVQVHSTKLETLELDNNAKVFQMNAGKDVSRRKSAEELRGMVKVDMCSVHCDLLRWTYSYPNGWVSTYSTSPCWTRSSLQETSSYIQMGG